MGFAALSGAFFEIRTPSYDCVGARLVDLTSQRKVYLQYFCLLDVQVLVAGRVAIVKSLS